MAYQALYRQWRPKLFSQVVGQDAIISTLRRQVQTGRIAHAYLFSGTRGTGKTSTAQILAKAVNCAQPDEGEPCGVCESCVALEEGASLDVEEIDAASNNGVDEIRALRDKIRYPPQVGRFRVYIVDEVHMLSTSAFNALLKTLEEPPAHAVMILATTEPQRLPATILSRCQRFDFKRIPAAQIAQRLHEGAQKAGIEVEQDALRAIARAAEGGMRDAWNLLDVCVARGGKVTLDALEEAIGSAGRAFLGQIAQALADGDAAAALRCVDRAMRDGRDAAVLTRDICAHLRDAMIAREMGAEAAEVLELSAEEASALAAQGKAIGNNRVMRALDILSHTEPQMRWAAHPRALLELSLARICMPQGDQDIDALLQRVEALERALAQGAVAAAARVPDAAGAASPAPAVPSPAPPPPTAPPVPAAKPSAGDGDIWKNALAAVRKTNVPLYMTTLKRARLEGIRGDVAQVAFAPEDGVYADMLRQQKNLEALQGALSGAAGREISVQVSLGGAEPPAEPTNRESDSDMVDEIVALFGRENVQIVEGSE